jgi:hypothetical protein
MKPDDDSPAPIVFVGTSEEYDFSHPPQTPLVLYYHSAEEVWGSIVFDNVMVDKSGRLVG